MPTRLIEQTFPIREISELAIPERSSYKPIYQISKWFARRASSTFRAILLGSILPPTADLMTNFYNDHEFSDVTVIDPFMGGGTTIIEGLRLGLNCIGIDINPIAWFITKTEAELIDLGELKKWIMDCENKLKDQIKKLYLTTCPVCNYQADIIYAHWVKMVPCEVCNSQVPLFRNFVVAVKNKITSILCASCGSIFEYSGSVPNLVSCPHCLFKFNPLLGNRVGRNTCRCSSCGNTTNILDFLKKNHHVLKSKMYAIEGFCPNCADDDNQESPLKITRYKFVKGVSETDIDFFNQIEDQWKRSSAKQLYPEESIPLGVATKTLHNHNYTRWEELFNSRQLLALSMILQYIQKVPDAIYQEMLLAAFINLLNHNNVFTRYSPKGQKVEGIFARHDFHPLSTFAENNVWGTKYGRGTWQKCLKRLLKGKEYNIHPYNYKPQKKKHGKQKSFSGKIEGKPISEFCETFPSTENNLLLMCKDSEDLKDLPMSVDLFISDPPYADNVNYSELSDFFYVWVRLVLKDRYQWFLAKETPKEAEAIISQDRPLNYYDKLVGIFQGVKTKLKSDGLLVFTFHHSDKHTWVKLADVILRSGFQVVKTYSVPSEARNVLNMQKKKAIAFDLIIVCRSKVQKQQQTISLEKFLNHFENSYKKQITMFRETNIEVKDYDHLAICFGILLEMDSRYQVTTPSGVVLAQNEIWDSCYEFVSSSQ
ncbi:MAG: DUF1156 domain-containing protein [Candidatus Heimdallarchaeota archaeon]|nr:MAG: DUF1156 domain-containing protein [Candidatus Heimdallarchaeota archaeon]